MFEVSLKLFNRGATSRTWRDKQENCSIAVMIMAPRSLQFASFTLDLDRLCLFGPHGRAELRPKSFEVLRYLVDHVGRVVGKEEVIQAVWADVTVTDESLTRCISEVRRALGDESQRIIKTIPKRGYLFDSPVSARDVTVLPPAVKVVRSADHLREPEAETVDRDAVSHDRKYVTVLCTELKESLERIARRDPEEALKIFKVALPLMMQAFHQYDGTINEVTGDEIMALVGAPLTNEDHVHIAMSLLGSRADARELPDLDVTADKADQSFKEKWNALLRYQGKPFDEEKWNALLRYDEAIANAAAKVRPFGDKWVDELARAYLVLEDKQYLPNILTNIICDAKREADERQTNPKPERSQPVDQTNGILSRSQRWVSSWVVWLRFPMVVVAFLALVAAKHHEKFANGGI